MPKVIQPLGTSAPSSAQETYKENSQAQHTASANTVQQPQSMPQPVTANTEPGPSPVGMSANSLELKTDPGHNWPGLIKKLLPVIVLLLIAAAGWFFYKNHFSGLGTSTLSNGGYNYLVEFFKPHNQVRLNDNSEALKHAGTILSLKPSDGPRPHSCPQIGNGWTEAFRVDVYGQTAPVCQAGSLGNYTMFFSADNQRHLFSITFEHAPSKDIHPDLRTIFESVTVSSP